MTDNYFIFTRDYREICYRLHHCERLSQVEETLSYAFMMTDRLGFMVEKAATGRYEVETVTASPLSAEATHLLACIWKGFNRCMRYSPLRIIEFRIEAVRDPESRQLRSVRTHNVVMAQCEPQLKWHMSYDIDYYLND